MQCKVEGWSTNVTNCVREVTGSQPYTQSYRQLSEVGVGSALPREEYSNIICAQQVLVRNTYLYKYKYACDIINANKGHDFEGEQGGVYGSLGR